MKTLMTIAGALCVGLISPCWAQTNDASDDSDYLASADARNSGQARPAIGIKRRADFVMVSVSFISDTRDALVRRQEVHTMISAALDRASGGIELASGVPTVTPVTKDNYQSLQMSWAGREDTSKVDVLVKVPITTTANEADKRVYAFVKALPRNGRGTITRTLGWQLAIRNPNQYRGAIIAQIAEDVRRSALAFGPDYRGSIDGLDKPVLWAQSGDSDVFLYLPYSYRIMAK